MARQRGVDTKVQITRGFVTEFTPLAFPQEAAIDIDNCIIDTDGRITSYNVCYTKLLRGVNSVTNPRVICTFVSTPLCLAMLLS